jgi:hypothetical protein
MIVQCAMNSSGGNSQGFGNIEQRYILHGLRVSRKRIPATAWSYDRPKARLKTAMHRKR